jgi:hypothetical protein
MRPVSAALMALVFWCLAPQVSQAQTCPPNAQARALEARRDPFGIYCMRVFQAGYARQICARARAAIDLDECQYLSELLIESLQRCAALGPPYGAKCSAMIPQAKGMLRAVNANPVLVEHRQEQRGRASAGNACRGNLGIQCSARCGGNPSCMAACNGGNAWQCNR